MRPDVYYRSYSRALISYANSGFFSRDLDADDVAFIEQVRESGRLRCGSLANLAPTDCTYSDDVISRVALIEEMEFWHLPYQIDQRIPRRQGPVIRPKPTPAGSTPAAIGRRERRELLEAARAAAFAEAAAKQAELLRRDIEWENAAPLPFGKVEGRHYVPQWKVDEQRRRGKVDRYQRDRSINRRRSTERRDAVSQGTLKERIVSKLNEIFPQTISIDRLMTVIGCDDKQLMIQAVNEIIGESRAQYLDRT